MTYGLPSRDEVLSGTLHSSRRATRIATAIEVRVAYLQTQVRQAIRANFFNGSAESDSDFRPEYLRGLKLSTRSGAEITTWDLERHADRWQVLVPPGAEARVALIEELARRGYLSRHVPRTLAALSFHDQSIRDRYERIRGRPLDSVLEAEVPPQRGQDELSVIEDSTVWVHLPAGGVLLRQGDTGSSAYIVISGRLRVTARGHDGVEQPIGYVGRGEIVGEAGPLAGVPRMATVRAARDSELIEIPWSAIERLERRHPELLIKLSREMVRRIATQAERHPCTQLATLAIVPANGPAADLARQLAEAFETHDQTLHLDRARVNGLFGMDPNEAAGDPVEDSRLAAWLDGQEVSFRYVLYEADGHPSPWTERCLRQADRILLVASAQHPPSLGPSSQMRDLDPARVELILLHPAGTIRPRDTRRWLALRRFRTHHHIRQGNSADVRRTVRRLTGRALGLVLSGGGARGFAHAGVIGALEDAGIEVDMIGGTSMGAWVGALSALGRSHRDIVDHARIFAGRRQLLDFTLPITSFVAGRKLTDMLQRETAGACIEDLWRPYFCISSNLSRAMQVIHREDLLWRGVRASTALPGIYPPVLQDGDILVDGGLINNFPLDIMRGSGEVGTVIGVNVTPIVEQGTYQFGDSISGWQSLRHTLRRSTEFAPPPTLFDTLARSMTLGSSNRMRDPEFLALADLLIQPRLGQFGTLDFDAYQPIIEAGYAVARRELERWQEAGGATT